MGCRLNFLPDCPSPPTPHSALHPSAFRVSAHCASVIHMVASFSCNFTLLFGLRRPSPSSPTHIVLPGLFHKAAAVAAKPSSLKVWINVCRGMDADTHTHTLQHAHMQ